MASSSIKDGLPWLKPSPSRKAIPSPIKFVLSIDSSACSAAAKTNPSESQQEFFPTVHAGAARNCAAYTVENLGRIWKAMTSKGPVARRARRTRRGFSLTWAQAGVKCSAFRASETGPCLKPLLENVSWVPGKSLTQVNGVYRGPVRFISCSSCCLRQPPLPLSAACEHTRLQTNNLEEEISHV